MNIVVVDGHTLNPGDLSWDELRALGAVTLHPRTAPEQIQERARDADAVITNKVQFTAETLGRLPRLRYIGVTATGYNCVDVRAAAARGIVVTNVPTYGTDSVAQLVFALLLDLCRGPRQHSDAVHRGEWSHCPDFCFWQTPQLELTGRTMGLIGFGRIGRQVARIADAMGMAIIATDAQRMEPPPLRSFRWTELRETLAAADVVSLHCPLTEETRHLIRRETLQWMKPTAFLINTSRGPLVHEADLAAALDSGRIAGAAVDVLSAEPPPDDNPLLHARNCLITPHIAWATQEARARLMRVTVENLRAFLTGRPQNVVNG
jgi:glycerate dehydrogenase